PERQRRPRFQDMTVRRMPGERPTQRVRRENLSALGPGADTVRRVDRVADDGELEPPLGADRSRERLAVVEAHSDLEFRTTLGPPACVESYQRLPHVDRCLERSIGIVRGAER